MKQARLFAILFLLVLGACRPMMAAQTGSLKINPIDGAEMVYVPAGYFTMGSANNDKDARADEKPAHKVYLDGYWIYKYEVTYSQYERFCDSTGRAMPNDQYQAGCPIWNVSWEDAVAYAKWAQAELPTEAQWEKAARGPHGRIFPWGNVWDDTKCVSAVSNALGIVTGAMTVGACRSGASPYGALDMAGNTWEWCRDWYDAKYYQTSPLRNPMGPATGRFRVRRGGSWNCISIVLFRCADRDHYGFPSDHYYDSGFRCIVPAGAH